VLEIGTATGDRRASRLTSTCYGAGAALTLDEFALWLNLQDVYWAKQGRESIDAVVLFGSLLSIGLIGKDFLRELPHMRASLERDEQEVFGDGQPGPATPSR
jgi:hypothetical protein